MNIAVKRMVQTILILFGLTCLIEPAYAESYLVYEEFPPVIWLSGKPCCKKRCVRRHRHKIVCKKRKAKCCYRNRRSRCNMTVTYIFPVVPPCSGRCAPTAFAQGGCTSCGAGIGCASGCGNQMVVNDGIGNSGISNYDVMVPRPTVVYADSDRYYNPDLATADDDSMFDPELNIDR